MTDAATPSPVPARTPSRLRRWLPWLVGLALLAFIITRVPYEAFSASLGSGPHVALALANLAIFTLVLGSDSLSTWIGLLSMRVRRPLGKVLLARGATYALFVINYAVGQGGFGYYLHRTGETPLRSVGITLFLIGTNLAGLILVTLGAWLFYGNVEQHPEMWWTLVVGAIGFVLYLAIIAASPAPVARREVFAPLLDAGVRGHLLAVAGRVPHVFVTVLGQWAALRVWGIPAPLSVGLTIMPAVVIASVLPISVAGLGTTQAAFVLFFSAYAPGATPDAQAANVLAFSVAQFVYSTVASLIIGFVCLPIARRAGIAQSSDDTNTNNGGAADR